MILWKEVHLVNVDLITGYGGLMIELFEKMIYLHAFALK